MAENNEPILIKKYANRRLYDTSISQYITLEDVGKMVKKGEEFKVMEAKTGKDLTRSVLAQIIVDEEANGESLLPISFLRQIIGMYEDNMRPFVPQYLEQMMDQFVQNQERLAAQMSDMPGMDVMMGGEPVRQANRTIKEMTESNMALWNNTVRMMNPFISDPAGSAQESKMSKEQELASLKKSLKDIQSRINEIESASA